MTISPLPTDSTTGPTTNADERVVQRLQRTIDRLIRQRDGLIAERDALVEHRSHWFVNDGNGYCLACATPAKNARHCERAS